MRKRLLAGLGVLVLTSSSVDAQTLNIDHQPVGCAVAEKFPRLEARFTPGDAVATARVLFQSENTKHWYAVAMKSEGPAFSGVLPKPKKSLKAFQYYIEVTDKSLGTNRTANYTTSVVATSAGCQGKVVAGSLGSASVLLQAPPGAATLPAGFASNGVVVAGRGAAAASSSAGGGAAGAGAATAGAAAGGGIGTAAVIGIVAGAGAAAAGVAVATGAVGGEGSPSSEPPPPPPPPSTSYTGPFTGQRFVHFGPPPGCESYIEAVSGTMLVTLQPVTSGTVTGTARTTGAFTIIAITGNCVSNAIGVVRGINWELPVTGTPGGLVFSAQRAGGSPECCPDAIEFSGALSSGVISGMVTFTHSGAGGRLGVATLPVTLR